MIKGVLITIIIVVAIAIVIGFVSFGDRNKNLNSDGTTSKTDNIGIDSSIDDSGITNNGDSLNTNTNTVEMSSSGFSPSTLTINVGDLVTFTTIDSGSYWPATAFHPSHTVYPGSSLSKCNSVEKDSIFDSCKNIGSGESYTFTFNEVGSWNYHDHRRASRTGTIIVN